MFPVNLSSFASGVAIGWSSPAIVRLNGNIDPDNNPLPFKLGPEQESWIAGLFLLGAVVGPFIFGYGKNALLICNIPVIIGFIMQAFANHVDYIYVARFLGGVGCGCIFTLAPMYMAEIAENTNRGALGCFMPIFTTAGVLFAYCVGPYLTIKWFSLVCSLPSVLFIILVFLYVPESPHYYVSKNLSIKAAQSLAKFRNQSLELVKEELEEIKQYVVESLANKGKCKDLFICEGLKKAFLINIMLTIIQQFSGISVLLSYMQSIFVATGSEIPSEISSIIIAAVLLLASALTPLVVDRLGRRPILLFSTLTTSISQGIIGLYFYLENNKYDAAAISWLPLFSLIIYMLSFNLGIGPLPWVIMGEMFPPNLKSIAASIIVASNSFLAFFTAIIFPYFIIYCGMAVSFWIFSICCMAGCIFIHFFVLETKGKSLNEIQLMLNGNKK